MTNCEDCPKMVLCHNEILDDLQILGAISYSLEHNHIEQSKDELGILQRRLRQRHLKITGRD